MLRSCLLALCLLVCLACASPFPVEDLEEGMTEEEARQVFGEPRNIRDDKAWVYTDEEQRWFMIPFFPVALIAGPVIALLEDDLSEWDVFFVSKQPVYLHFEGEKLARWWVGDLEPHGIEKPVVAIKVSMPGLFGSETTPSAIYFVRLDADGGYRHGGVFVSDTPSKIYYVPRDAHGGHRQERLRVSNAGWGRLLDYSYLVNASPGRYAAVGARTDSYNLDEGAQYSSSSYWLFPEDMINETIVTVESSGVTFMGEFKLSGDLRLDDADDTQTYYSYVFTGSAPQNAVTRLLHRLGTAYLAEYQKDQSEMASQRFMEASRPLAETGWRALIPQEFGDREKTEAPE